MESSEADAASGPAEASLSWFDAMEAQRHEAILRRRVEEARRAADYVAALDPTRPVNLKAVGAAVRFIRFWTLKHEVGAVHAGQLPPRLFDGDLDMNPAHRIQTQPSQHQQPAASAAAAATTAASQSRAEKRERERDDQAREEPEAESADGEVGDEKEDQRAKKRRKTDDGTYEKVVPGATRVEGGYQCDECGKIIQRSNYFKIHQRIHTGERPYKCPMCDSAFSQSSGLKSHIRIHGDDRPLHPCTECDVRFLTTAGLKAHMQTHAVGPPAR